MQEMDVYIPPHPHHEKISAQAVIVEAARAVRPELQRAAAARRKRRKAFS
jgi:hypothetical protein